MGEKIYFFPPLLEINLGTPTGHEVLIDCKYFLLKEHNSTVCISREHVSCSEHRIFFALKVRLAENNVVLPTGWVGWAQNFPPVMTGAFFRFPPPRLGRALGGGGGGGEGWLGPFFFICFFLPKNFFPF